MNNLNIITIIPARSGSKGIPNKNIIDFLDKPLLAHSISFSINCNMISSTYVSTDDDEIANISKSYGAKIIKRPKELALDTSTTESAIEHMLGSLNPEPDVIVLLQATSPLRPKKSLDSALHTFLDGKFDSLLSISPTHRFFWKIDNQATIPQYDFINRPRRQDMKIDDLTYVENGSIYIFTRKHFEKHKNRLGGKIGHIIFPEEYSYEIDTLADVDFLGRIANQISE